MPVWMERIYMHDFFDDGSNTFSEADDSSDDLSMADGALLTPLAVHGASYVARRNKRRRLKHKSRDQLPSTV